MPKDERERTNGTAKPEDAYGANLGANRGMRFVDIFQNRPVYFGEVRSVGLLSANRVNGEGLSLLAFRSHLSHRDMEIDTPSGEGELELSDIENCAIGGFGGRSMACLDSRSLICRSNGRQHALMIR